jgi:hypothetical protein
MELWIKEANLKLIEQGGEAGLIEGVYVEHQTSPEEIADFLEAQGGPVVVPLKGKKEEEILEEAQELFYVSNRIVPLLTFEPKLCATLHHLFRLGIWIACRVENSLEGWLASKAGATHLIAKPLPFAFLETKKWRTHGNREVPLFIEAGKEIDTLFSAPVPVEGVILAPSLIESWISAPALAQTR